MHRLRDAARENAADVVAAVGAAVYFLAFLVAINAALGKLSY